MTKKKQTFETALSRLEDIVNNLESGDISLEDSMNVFEEGSELVKFCLSQLDTAEKKIQKLRTDDKGEIQLDLL